MQRKPQQDNTKPTWAGSCACWWRWGSICGQCRSSPGRGCLRWWPPSPPQSTRPGRCSCATSGSRKKSVGGSVKASLDDDYLLQRCQYASSALHVGWSKRFLKPLYPQLSGPSSLPGETIKMWPRRSTYLKTSFLPPAFILKHPQHFDSRHGRTKCHKNYLFFSISQS